jgi:hypothetical protein
VKEKTMAYSAWEKKHGVPQRMRQRQKEYTERATHNPYYKGKGLANDKSGANVLGKVLDLVLKLFAK